MAANRQLGEAQPLGLRLFLEGVEVPVAAATIDINEGAAAVAQIEIVALDSAFDFKPRTVVHLFFFDGDAWKYAPGQPHETYYKLLFSGELFSYTFQKSGAGSRSFVLNCIDFSNYWDTSYIFQVSDADTLLDVGQTQPFVTGSDAYANSIITPGHMSQFIEMLQAQSRLPQAVPPAETSSFVSSLMGFLELLGGVSVLDDDATVTADAKEKTAQRTSIHGGMNAWHTITERRVRLLDQIAVDSGKTAAALFKEDSFLQFLKGQADLSSSVLSFRDILGLLLGHIYYTSYPNPCGRLLAGTSVTTTPLTPGTSPDGAGVSGGRTPPRPYIPPSGLTVDPTFLPVRAGKRMTVEELATERRLFGLPEPSPFAESDVSDDELFGTSSEEEVPEELGESSSDGSVDAETAQFRPEYETGWAYEQLSANYKFADICTTRNTQFRAAQLSEGVGVYNYLRDLCLFIVEPLRAFFATKNITVSISSGFRSQALNESLRPRSAKNSDHMRGMAVDLTFSGTSPWEAYKTIRLDWIPGQPDGLVGQLIFEKMGTGSGWVHLSLGTLWGGFAYWPAIGITGGSGLVKIPVRGFPNIARDTPQPTE